MSAVADGTCLDTAGFKQQASFSKAALCAQINPIFFFFLFWPDKAVVFNSSRIKRPKSRHRHLAKATGERAEQFTWDTKDDGGGGGEAQVGVLKRSFAPFTAEFMQRYCDNLHGGETGFFPVLQKCLWKPWNQITEDVYWPKTIEIQGHHGCQCQWAELGSKWLALTQLH